ncbi:MAG: cysteine desulfurase-like protein [Candidatus Eisenbacteria bacterium]|nr:cysteine desulfurase-like protein [Candidatus Eisenbacteria bacterium]
MTFSDPAALRARFPALAGQTIYFENAGGSQLPDVVIDAMTDYLRHHYVQLGAGYPASREATRIVDEAHAFARRLVGTENGHAILGASTTILLRILADCYADILPPKSEIVISEAGHEANINPWLRLERAGHVIRWWRVDPTREDAPLSSLDALLNEHTRLVVLPQVSNLLGAVTDVAEVARRAHRVGARVVVDGVAFAAHRPVDVTDWDVDWYVFSNYKVYGPHMAVLYGSAAAVAELTGPNHFFIPKEMVPYKFELGGSNHEGCAGLVALGRYLNVVAGRPEADPCDRETVVSAFQRMGSLELPLQARLISWLADRPGVRIVGPGTAGPERVPVISFRVAGRASAEICRAVDDTGVAIRSGHMYAYRLCQALGIDPADGVVRVSLLHYNTLAEVDRLIEVLDGVLI